MLNFILLIETLSFSISRIQTSHVQFHFGAGEGPGSEHTINGTAFQAEVRSFKGGGRSTRIQKQLIYSLVLLRKYFVFRIITIFLFIYIFLHRVNNVLFMVVR